MRTSKISNHTKGGSSSSTKPTPEPIALTSRHTRSFARTLRRFAAAEAVFSTHAGNEDGDDLKQSFKRERDEAEKEDGKENDNDVDNDASDLSSLSSIDLAVIEDTVEDNLTSSTSVQKSSSDLTPSRRSPRRKVMKKLKLDSGVENNKHRRPRASSTRKATQGETKSQNEVTIHQQPPPDWLETYNTMKAMRAKILAPVDTMGCERLADPTASPRTQRFQTLLALMLSSQTKDTVTSAVIRNMQRTLPAPGLTLETILSLTAAELNAHIKPVGFHNTKTRAIQATAAILRDQHGSDIPETYAGLVALPGVGPKMAHLCLSAAWGRTEGIGVDTHVLRITRRWGWHAAEKPEEARARLESWLPRTYWAEINVLLVGFGQMVCLPVGRRCGMCEVGSGEGRGRCPSRIVGEEEVGVGGKRMKGKRKAVRDVEDWDGG